MGRNKLKIQKLETNNGRNVTYSKRRMGIIKKARELSILCDVDVLLLIFSTSGKPSLCLGEKRCHSKIWGAESTRKEQKALKKTFKKVEHEVNIKQLADQGEVENIDNIEDINMLVQLEHHISNLITHNQVSKENCAKNLMELHYNGESVMNQPIQQNEAFWYTMPDGQQIMLPANTMLHNGRDPSDFGIGYHEVPMNDPTQDIAWAQMGGTSQTFIDEPTDSMPLTETMLCIEISVDTNEILQNEGGANENENMAGTQFTCQGQEVWSNMSEAFLGRADLHLPEGSSNESNDFVDNLFEQNALFHEENVHDSNFHDWTSAGL
ncbi:MADS-box protein FLOWERING LOCUS C [Carex littledalei]|uniref:MADS-box protein FLOWERING LOCUS C n=1 Tax=Carex littledalei TaxID=544730 RepID=A0A833RBC2_9POAL|nr:MADS-box protein FLOWERING LOCUS C [Carex littledalei]